MPINTILPYEEHLDHMIIWLSQDIGEPGRHQRLKKAFSTTLDPKNESPTNLFDNDYVEAFDNIGLQAVDYEGVWFLLAAFTNIERCIECFERNQEKRIFFITSGSMGETAVPIILNRFRHIFTDPVTNQPCCSIYVYCHNIEYHMHWALEYRDYIQIFNFDAVLLSRMIRDIADYYVDRSRRLLEEDPPKNLAAYHRLHWANILYQRYSKMEDVSLKKEFDEVNQLLEEAEEELRSSSDEDD